MNFIDLFAGAGGLSEGFIREGFNPIAHVEMDSNACDTLRTRTSYHYLEKTDQLDIYKSYLKKEISREELWNKIPESLHNSIINEEITEKTINCIFQRIDKQLQEKRLI
jgi:DNA (cytosine-5)-methyltransferase 1